MAIAESLKRFRKQFGLTQKNVAELLNIKTQAYSQYENPFKNDKPVTPKVNVIIDLSKAYNVSADYLLGLIDDPRPLKTVNAPIEKPTTTSDEYVSRAEMTELKSALAAQGIKI